MKRLAPTIFVFAILLCGGCGGGGSTTLPFDGATFTQAEARSAVLAEFYQNLSSVTWEGSWHNDEDGADNSISLTVSTPPTLNETLSGTEDAFVFDCGVVHARVRTSSRSYTLPQVHHSNDEDGTPWRWRLTGTVNGDTWAGSVIKERYGADPGDPITVGHFSLACGASYE